MKITKQLLAKFDTPDTLLVVSPYPKKGETYSAGISGIASYTKNIVSPLQRPIVVFTHYKNNPSYYVEDHVLVIRCFKLDTPQQWKQIYTQLKKFELAKQLLVQFDFSLYGDILNSSLIIPFLILIKKLGKKINFTFHSVVTDINRLSGHVGLGNTLIDRIKAKTLNFSFKSFYTAVGGLSDQVIVLEDPLKKRLTNFIKKEKVTTLTHPVDTQLKKISKAQARKKLGIKKNEQVVLFFGYINWFKGTDFFVETFKNTKRILNNPARFIIAGGQSATLKDQSSYQSYFTKTEYLAHQCPQIEITGYVPQEEIATYFSAADLVVFPYRYFMCASGVLSLAFSYQKPFIISESLSQITQANDFKETLNEVGLKNRDVFFELDNNSLKKITKKVLRNGIKKKMIKMAQTMRKKRAYEQLSLNLENQIFKEKSPEIAPVKGSLQYAKI